MARLRAARPRWRSQAGIGRRPPIPPEAIVHRLGLLAAVTIAGVALGSCGLDPIASGGASLAAGLAVGHGGGGPAAQPADTPPASRNFRAHLSGAADGADTLAQGQAVFQLSGDGSELSYKLIAANIENVTQAHIHMAPEGSNGPIVAR